MQFLFVKNMQSDVLRKILTTPIQHGLHIGDINLKPSFFTTSSSRRGAYTASLMPGDEEYDTILQRILKGVKAVDEAQEEVDARIQDDTDPFRSVCPGCRKHCTVDFDAWDITRDGESHITCPVLDVDPSAHIMSADVRSAAATEEEALQSLKELLAFVTTTSCESTTSSQDVTTTSSVSATTVQNLTTTTLRKRRQRSESTTTDDDQPAATRARRQPPDLTHTTYNVQRDSPHRASTGRITRRPNNLDL